MSDDLLGDETRRLLHLADAGLRSPTEEVDQFEVYELVESVVPAAVARVAELEAAIETHHADIWAEWSPVSRSCPPPADVSLWAHVGIDPVAVLAAPVTPETSDPPPIGDEALGAFIQWARDNRGVVVFAPGMARRVFDAYSNTAPGTETFIDVSDIWPEAGVSRPSAVATPVPPEPTE